MLLIRTFFLYFCMAAYTLTVGIILILLAFLVPQQHRAMFLLNTWIKVMLLFVRWIGGVSWTVEGLEHLNTAPNGVILSKHQSILETLLYQQIFYPALHIAKASLQWVPVFGWGLKMIGTVFIDRSQKKDARKQIFEKGQQRMNEGNWLVIYPEGTRVPPGESKPFKTGGADAAIAFGCKIFPVAHNAGEFWNKQGIVKTGTARFIIGQGIETQGRKAKELTSEVEQWILSTVAKIS